MKKTGSSFLKGCGFFFSLFFLLIGSIGFADENCIDHYVLTGETKGLNQQSYHYQLVEVGGQLSGELAMTFSLNGKKINESGSGFYYTFTEPGTYSLKAQLKSETCNETLEKTISIYDKNILYLGTAGDFLNFGFEEELNKAGFLFTKIITNKEKKADPDQLLPFANAELVIINDKDFQLFLEKYLLVKKATTPQLEKNIIIITDLNKNLLKRSLAQYAKSLTNDTITIINSENVMNLLSDISLGKNYHEQGYSTQFSREFKDTPKWMAISYLVDELLKTGFPLQILGLFLSLSVVALVISFSRQVIGLGAFGVYQPLLFALIATIAGIKIGIFLFLTAIIAGILIKLLTNRFYLLYSSKVSLFITLFLVCFLLLATISEKFGFSILMLKGDSVFTIRFIFPLIISVLVVDKTFSHFKIWTKGRWINCIEFILISAISYGILQRSSLSEFLLSYPETILAILIINGVIGRFSGLQLLELIRFMPLIKRHLDEEEE